MFCLYLISLNKQFWFKPFMWNGSAGNLYTFPISTSVHLREAHFLPKISKQISRGSVIFQKKVGFTHICLIQEFVIIKFLPKRISSERGSVLKVRCGSYNYRLKLYKWLNVDTKTVVANSCWQIFKMRHVTSLYFKFQYNIHKNALKN